MSILPILTWPDPRLQSVCAPVAQVSTGTWKLAEDMLETMYCAPGRGLAAPQVGVMKRLFVMDTDWKEGTPVPQVFVNPEIVGSSKEVVQNEEGCLSIPGVMAQVTRPDWVEVRWTGLDGRAKEGRFEGFAAACVQHEMDHLDGRLTFDHLEPEARTEMLAAYGAP